MISAEDSYFRGKNSELPPNFRPQKTYLRHGQSPFWLSSEDSSDDVHAVRRQEFGNDELSIENGAFESGHGAALEGHHARHHEVQQYPERPNIHRRSHVVIVLKDGQKNWSVGNLDLPRKC